MYHPMLFIHWKQARLPLLPFVVGAFGLPLLSIQGLGSVVDPGSFSYAMSAVTFLALPLYPILAFLIGAGLALTAWNWDHQLNHVYALSLPLARWEYAMLKMGAGIALALVPTFALWTGAHVASLSVTLPEGLHAYPNQLTLRFFFAVLLSYALVFALAAGTVKTSLWVVSAAVLTLVVGVSALESMGLADVVLQRLWMAGGPFEVFTGNWTLIDV
jgi:hypothetical protein